MKLCTPSFAFICLSAVPGLLHADPAAYRLEGADDLKVWGCTPLVKVMRDAPAPEAVGTAACLSAARNEYESVQIVLVPVRDLDEADVSVHGLSAAAGGAPIPAENVRLEWVEYVNVTRPTDGLGKAGWWPDPLTPCGTPRDLPKGVNQPVWVTVHVPPETPAGEYAGAVKISWKGGGKPVYVSLSLRVRGFALPAEFHTKTAYGVSINDDWHHLKTPEERRQVYDLYLAVLARHHISPYSPMTYYPNRERTEGGQTTLDFTAFDEGASRYLDGFHFNAFNLDLPLGFSERPSFPPEFRQKFGERIRPILDHLREKGWLSKTYAYWQDEPPKARYAWVKEGMETLKEHAPGVRRLLTMCNEPAPMPEFYGLVDLWCPVMNFYSPATAPERQKLGESVWWYVCCGPQSPWPNNFIDHPAVTHRIRYWVMEKYGVEGDLYWSTTYWWQKNPWEDPESYASRDGGKDPAQVWGNGDGFLLYPPTRRPPTEPERRGPCASIRMALIRDGLEDREYFRLLDGRPEAAARARARLDALVTDFTHFEHDPEKIEAAREALAEMIEAAK